MMMAVTMMKMLRASLASSLGSNAQNVQINRKVPRPALRLCQPNRPAQLLCQPHQARRGAQHPRAR